MARTSTTLDLDDNDLAEATQIATEHTVYPEHGTLTVNRDAIIRLALAEGLKELRRRRELGALPLDLAEHVD